MSTVPQLHYHKETFRTMERPHEPHPEIAVELFVRDDCQNDLDVCNEVIRGDAYHLQRMKAVGFEPQTIADIGAHIGSFSAFAKKLWPKADVIAVEPHPSSFELLTLNCPFAETHNVAIGGTGRLMRLSYPKGEYGGARAWVNREWNFDGASAVVKRLREITERLENIDLLKLDCEGQEQFIFGEGEPGLENVRCIVGEYHLVGPVGNAFYQLRRSMSYNCPRLTVITDEDRWPDSALGSKIGPFMAFETSHDWRLYETRRSCLPPPEMK